MRVLVVDDNEINRKLLKIMLIAGGHEPIEAADGLDALDVLRGGGFDAVITDILMPRMDGYRLCYEVRRNKLLRDLPIIVHSSTYSSEADARLALVVGADRFIPKPAAAETILQTLIELQGSPRPRTTAAPPTGDLDVLKEYSESLVRKLEEKNLELEASERRYRELVALAPIGIYRATREGRFVSVNAAYARLLGYDSAEEVLHLDLRQDIYFENADRERLIAELESQGDAAATELRLKRRDGGPVWVRQEARAIRGGSGAIEFIEGFVHDIHQSKRAEEALRQSEERFRRSFSVSPVGMSLSEAKTGRIVDVNERLASMLGYEREELIGRTAIEGGLWVDLSERERVVADVEASVPVREREVRLRTKSGDIRYVLDSIEPLQVGEERVLLSAFQDITERKRAVELLRIGEARKSAVLEAAQEAIITIDQDGIVIEVNPATERTFGYDATEMMGRELAELIVPPAFRDRHRRGLERQRRTGEAAILNRVLEMTAMRKDGLEFPVELFISRVDVEGTPLFIGYVRDLTDRKALEEQLRVSQKMEAIGQLAGGIAHDFNNLLTAILGYAELLDEQLADSPVLRDEVVEIRKAGERAASLTRQLLAFSRRQVLDLKVLDGNEVVRNIERMLKRLIGEDIDLVTILDPQLDLIRADSGQLEQVIMNLAVNSRDAMPRGGKLTIETSNVELDDLYARTHISVRPGNYVMLAVTDTGVGMDAGTVARVFEPFFTTKERGKGTGLGLSTVYGIVKQSEGYVWVYSEPQKGTTFKVYLPRVAAERATADRVPEIAPARGSETILLVEDEALVRKLTRTLLEGLGYTVLEAGGGEDALEIARAHPGPVHLVLTDVVMPEMGGVDLASRLQADRPEIRVLYMSGYTDDAIVRHKILESGTTFLQKPFTGPVLARKVREALS